MSSTKRAVLRCSFYCAGNGVWRLVGACVDHPYRQTSNKLIKIQTFMGQHRDRVAPMRRWLSVSKEGRNCAGVHREKICGDLRIAEFVHVVAKTYHGDILGLAWPYRRRPPQVKLDGKPVFDCFISNPPAPSAETKTTAQKNEARQQR